MGPQTGSVLNAPDTILDNVALDFASDRVVPIVHDDTWFSVYRADTQAPLLKARGASPENFGKLLKHVKI